MCRSKNGYCCGRKVRDNSSFRTSDDHVLKTDQLTNRRTYMLLYVILSPGYLRSNVWHCARRRETWSVLDPRLAFGTRNRCADAQTLLVPSISEQRLLDVKKLAEFCKALLDMHFPSVATPWIELSPFMIFICFRCLSTSCAGIL